MTTRRPPQEASPLAAEADPSPEIQYLVEPERRMSDLSSEKPDGAKRFSTRGNWHMRPRVGIMGGTFDISSTGKKGKSIKVDGISKKAEGANVTTNPSYYFDFII